MKSAKNYILDGLYGSTDTLLAVIQENRYDPMCSVYWIDRADFAREDACHFDTGCQTRYFTGLKSDGIKITYGNAKKEGGREALERIGHYLCQIPTADIDNLSDAEETDGGHACEILIGDEVCEIHLDLEGKDIKLKARFTPTRKSTRFLQVKFWRYGCSAHFSKRLAEK